MDIPVIKPNSDRLLIDEAVKTRKPVERTSVVTSIALPLPKRVSFTAFDESLPYMK